MATTVRAVDYFATDIPDKPGEGARALEALRDSGVNLLALSAFPRGRRSQVDFIAEDSGKLKAAARRAGLKLRAKKTAFLIQGEDKPGAVAEVIAKLADKNINVTAIDAVCAGAGRFGALLWVKPADVARAKRAFAKQTPAD